MRKRMDAYLTVEAVMVLPIVFGVLLFIICFWFYQYDRCLMEQDAGLLALRGTVIPAEDAEERIKAVKKILAERPIEKYIVWEDLGTDIKIERGKIRVRQRGNIRFPFSGLAFWDGEDIWEMSVLYENELMSPASLLRKYQKIKGGT